MIRITAKGAAHTPEPILSRSRIEELFAHRSATLSSLRSHVSRELFEAIEQKITYECSYLCESAAAHEKTLEAKRKLQTALKPEYFLQKTLDANDL